MTRHVKKSAYYALSADGTRSRLAMGSLRMLAGLLLADGRIVSSHEIAQWAMPWMGSRGSVTHWQRVLVDHGCRVETVYPHGYRLAALPPDDLLDDVLVIARALRREEPTRLWHLIGMDQRPMTKLERRAARRAAISLTRTRRLSA
jgi:biotin operon repressor